jgi:hypothetical protein
LRYATADGVADQAATQVLAGLPDDYVDRSLALLRSVTPEAATEAYRSVVHPDELTLVVVGDAERLAEPLRQQASPTSKSGRPPSGQPPSARSARFTAALASFIFFWYVARSPEVSALSAASKAASASLSAFVAAGLSTLPVGLFPSALPSSVLPPALPWKTWSSACCKVSPMPTDSPKRTTTKRSAG